MDNDNMKEVYFDAYCPTCIYKDKEESDMKCHDCLNEPARKYTHKPINWTENSR